MAPADSEPELSEVEKIIAEARTLPIEEHYLRAIEKSSGKIMRGGNKK